MQVSHHKNFFFYLGTSIKYTILLNLEIFILLGLRSQSHGQRNKIVILLGLLYARRNLKIIFKHSESVNALDRD